MRDWIVISLVLVTVFHCSEKKDQTSTSIENDKPELPVVTDSRSDLVLSWFSDGGAGVASSVKDVPDDAKGEVRVQDPSIPPELRDPKWIFFADLTKPDGKGIYPVRAELRADYETRRRKDVATHAQEGGGGVSPTPGIPGGSADVIMYATRHCPVCHKARRWLLEKKIPYVERDLEIDPQAAVELAKKGQAQGVPTSGVPIFEIRGRLVPGFDPPTIQKLLTH